MASAADVYATRVAAGEEQGQMVPFMQMQDEASKAGDLPLAGSPSIALLAASAEAEKPSPTPRLMIDNVVKQFGNFQALRGVTFNVNAGEIHALLGANGAGKSTLIRILAGYHKCDSGQTRLVPNHDLQAESTIEFIHQDLALVDSLSVAENIALVRGYPKRMGRISWRDVRKQAIETLAGVAGSIDVDAKVADLSRAEQSLVAIGRALANKCSVLVLDEPTASLPDSDVNRLFEILAGLKAQGISIIFVTHRLDEVRRIADRVTILCDGQVVADRSIDDISDSEVVRAIVGTGQVAHRRDPVELTDGGPVLMIQGGLIGDAIKPIDLALRRGEILGLAGLRGAGHEEVGRAIAGIEPFTAGKIELAGIATSLKSVRDAIALGIGFATSRREQEALAMTLTARENLFINPKISKRHPGWLIGKKRERFSATELAGQVMLRPLRPETMVGFFSGGNQQKVVLGRWLNVDLRVLVLEDPTIGIDVGARAEIYGLIYELAARGLGVIVISSDFEELAMICGRVLAFDRGIIAQEISAADLSVATITHAASGALN
ncbi:sugar ABC transporter ATP-binding protein [Mesorhizobium sp. M0047]|uniref:sugar ABC transporter ATP-binding protein n=1 Tax=Mesorhizobium sp. M0047 TaxID=2956859 RepID=UPI003337DEE7